MGETDLNPNSNSRADVERDSWEIAEGRRGPWERRGATPGYAHTLRTSPVGVFPVSCLPASSYLQAFAHAFLGPESSPPEFCLVTAMHF